MPAPSRLRLALLALALAGCQQLPMVSGPAPRASVEVMPGAASHATSEVAIAVQWPYRAQAIPTSAQRLRLQFSGLLPEQNPAPTDVTRPAGEAPLSLATMELAAGTGYHLVVTAYDASDRAIAQGAADFDAPANTRVAVEVPLSPMAVPAVTGFSPTNGGPGATVVITGENLGLDRGLLPGFTFGPGGAAAQGTAQGPASVSVFVPTGARSGALIPTVDGVSGEASTAAFTVLAALGITPMSRTISLSATDSAAFTAQATTDAGAAFLGPTVTWSLSMPAAAPAESPEPGQSPPPPEALPPIGTIDQAGGFVATGATGSAVLWIHSGNLAASAAVTVTP